MGVTVSTSLAKLKENPVLLKFVGETSIAENDEFWKELLSFSYVPTKTLTEAKLLEESTIPLVEALVRHNPHTGNLRTLVKVCLELAAGLRDESKCESNVATLRVHNALLILRLSIKHMLQNLTEDDVILQLDGSTTVPQITSLENKTEIITSAKTDASPSRSSNSLDPLASSFRQVINPVIDSSTVVVSSVKSLSENSPRERGEGKLDAVAVAASVNAAELVAMETLLSRQLVEGLVSLLAEVPLLPFTYDIHLEGLNLFIVLLSSQMFGGGDPPGLLLQHIVSIPSDLASLLVHCLLQHFTTAPPLPPEHFRSHSTGIISSITTGLWSLVMPSRGGSEKDSPLRDQSLLLLLVLAHQHTKGHNPYRTALFTFTDEHGDKSTCSFCISLEKLYLATCQYLTNEQATLFLYLLLQGNPSVASFIFSRADIDLLVLPLVQQLYDCGSQSSHHVYMLLIILLILSQDDCFNKHIHEKVLSRVPWYTERSVSNISLGSVMVMVLVRTIQVNMAQIRDKYLHTNCLAALANMSAHFHSLHLDTAQKLVNLFKQLAKKHHKIKERLKAPPQDSGSEGSEPTQHPEAMDQSIVEEILVMLLEIINSCLTHNLHNNPHLVYSLLYQRETFEPFRTHPSLMDLIQNIETVVVFFSSRLEKQGPPPYSSSFVLDTIIHASKSWPRNRLRVFPELKFRYVEEDQPEEFFIPYVWTLVFKASALYWDSSKIQFSTT